MSKGQNHGSVVRLRPVAYAKLTDLAEEFSAQRGFKVSRSQVVEAAIRTVDRLESVGVELRSGPRCADCRTDKPYYRRNDRELCGECLAADVVAEGKAELLHKEAVK